jgi:transcriptional regulator of acetoin/glycerol metabolism
MKQFREYEVNVNLEIQKMNKSVWREVFAEKTKRLESLPTTEIFDGWRRSAAYGIDPFKTSVNRVISTKSLNKLLEKNAFFLDICRPMMENLNSYVKDAGFNVAISNKNGILLTVMGEKDFVDETKEGRWIPGADWSEESIGNNGIGTALVLDKPLIVIGYEHYCRCCHNFASATAAIHDFENNIIGVIALCGQFKKIHAHTLGMVVATAKAIEIQFEINSALKEKELTAKYQQVIFNSISDGIISTTPNGEVRFCNRKCCELLDVKQDALIRTNIADLFMEKSYKLLKDANNHLENREVLLKTGDTHKRFICTTQFISGTGTFDGIVIALTDYTSAVKAAQKIVSSKPKWRFDTVVGRNPQFREMIGIAKIAAKTDSNIFLFGESGTGKDVLAQAIHNESPRNHEPFLAINCGAIPKELIASELFGYVEGSFTGARRGGNAGIFENAQKGTVFLDEIGEMPMEQQVVLLRVLDESSFSRIGSSKPIPFEARIIAATNKNIYHLIEKNLFRYDLFYRLNVFTISNVPLRERKDDIEELGNSYLMRLAVHSGKMFYPLRPAVLGLLTAYDWPGNIRELQNVLQRAFFLSPKGDITPEDLRFNVPPQFARPFEQPEIGAAKAPSPITQSIYDERDRFESELLMKSLEKNRWNISKTCKDLNLSRSTIYRWMKRHGIDKEM